MKKRKTTNWDNRVPKVTIDPSLDKYENVILFPEKLARANEMLKTTRLPNGELLISTIESGKNLDLIFKEAENCKPTSKDEHDTSLADYVPNAEIDTSLNKFRSVSLFPEKVARAKEDLAKADIPEIMRPMKSVNSSSEKPSLEELLLNGPVFTEDQIKEIEETHKSINKWRTDSPENLS